MAVEADRQGRSVVTFVVEQPGPGPTIDLSLIEALLGRIKELIETET
jgi:hypothetical protein